MCFALVFGSTTPAAGYLTLDELSDDIVRSRSIEASALSTRAWFASMEGSYDEGDDSPGSRSRSRSRSGRA